MTIFNLRSGVVCGLVAGVALIALMFATGSTFGQRCATQYEKGTAAWRVCVQTLLDGGDVGLGRRP